MIADFKDDVTRGMRTQSRMLAKGLVRIGCDVQRFSYRNILMQCCPLPGRNLALLLVKKKTDRLLAEQVRLYRPHVVLVAGMKYLDADTIRTVRLAAPDALIAGRDEDPFPERNPARLAIAAQTDVVMTTSGGRFLKTYKDAGVPRCAFVPNMCDPDLQHRYDVDDRWKTDLMFTGKAEHTRLDRYDQRYELVKKLASMPNARTYGTFGGPRVEGLEYFFAICGAKIALSINIASDVRLYHSDRLINYVSCGTFTLARKVPDTELLFEDDVHVKYFQSNEQFFDLAQRYLRDENRRRQVATAGMAAAHERFNCRKIAGIMLDIIENGRCTEPWAEVL